MTAPLQASDAARLERCIAGDGIALIPTDTVYGLACDPESKAALQRVYELKHRPPHKPAALMYFTVDAVPAALTESQPRTRAALEALLPGPVTLLLRNPERRFPHACDPAGKGTPRIGLRVPSLSPPLTALAAITAPVAQSSANLSGDPDPRSLQEISLELLEGVDVVLDAGELPGAASTVLDLSEYEQGGVWQIMREGPVSRSALEQLLP
jgi:L-threonylcarbamoyladenylate synthase